MEFMTTELK